jgi:hypothetical protein
VVATRKEFITQMFKMGLVVLNGVLPEPITVEEELDRM